MRSEAEHFHPEDQPHDSHLAGAFVANAAKAEAFHTPTSLDSHHHKHPSFSPPGSQKTPGPALTSAPASASKTTFRPPLPATRMFRAKSKESLNLQSLGSISPNGGQLSRHSSSNRMNATNSAAAPEGFDYSEMEAWQSFNAAGRVPHTAEEAGRNSIQIQPSGFRNLAPLLQSKSGEKAGTPHHNHAAPSSAGWFDEHGQENDDDHAHGAAEAEDGSDQVHDSHLAGAYVAHAAKTEAFRSPGILDKNIHRKAPPSVKGEIGSTNPLRSFSTSSKNNENTSDMERSSEKGGIFRASSITKMFTTSGKEGGGGGVSAPSPRNSASVNRKMGALKSLGSSSSLSPKNTANSAAAGVGTTHNRSFFDQPDGEESSEA